MPNLQNLYQIFKLPSTMIVENGMEIKNYTINRAVKDGTLVAIGDNLVFQQIRRYYGDHRTHREIFDVVQGFRKNEKFYKRQGLYADAATIDKHLKRILFVKDIINVEVVSKKEYAAIAKNGFTVNGIHYIRFMCGSGQMRRNTITFINEKLYDALYKNLMCGLDSKIKEMNIAKYHAYFALAFSSVLWVRKPRVCVIKDFFNVLPEQKVDWICPDPETGKKHIEERTMDLELNCADGQGLIDPSFAALWAEDMNLNYTPSSFVIRTCFVKGSVVAFDFKEYAAENGIDEIRDRWGIGHRIEDIDILLSESQFKMYKYYCSWAEYEKYANAADIQWGVARYNKKYDDEYVMANYQYLQTLNIGKEDIMTLIQPTIDWINKICGGDTKYSLLYLLGCKGDHVQYNQVYGSAQSLAVKAIVKNNRMLDDEFVQRKIYKNILENINKAKIGKVWIRGNYSFMISDPIAQCRAALGLPVKGELQADQVYSAFWNKKGVKRVDLCRSPMIDSHEHNPCDVVTSSEMEYWYQYIKSGVIYSIYDTSTFRHEDSDFDGDIVLSTDNEVFLKGAQKNHNIISYEKGAVPVKKICLANSIKCDIAGLGTGVGGFSNCATIMYAMRDIFTKDSQKSQRDELTLRIKLLREIVGQEIDRIKGTAKPELPREWKKMVRVNEDDDDAVKADKYRQNSMVIAKKPYFFRYLYPELNERFKQYEDNYNLISRTQFGVKLKKLMAKPNKSEAEMNLIRKYQKYSPLITSPCIMNTLCREVEGVDFKLQFDKQNNSVLSEFATGEYVDPEIVEKVRKLYRQYVSKKQVKVINDIITTDRTLAFDELTEIKFSILDELKANLQSKFAEIGIDNMALLNCCKVISQSVRNFNWDFVWDLLGESVLDLIPEGHSYVPIRNDNGFEYLGQNYIMCDLRDGNTYDLMDDEMMRELDEFIFDETEYEDIFADDFIFDDDYENFFKTINDGE